MASRTYKKLTGLRDAFSAAQEENDQTKIDLLNAEEKRLIKRLSPEEKYQYFIQQMADAFEEDYSKVDSYISEKCDSTDPLVKAIFVEGWTTGMTEEPDFMAKKREARIKKQNEELEAILGKPGQHLAEAQRILGVAPTDNDATHPGPKTLQ